MDTTTDIIVAGTGPAGLISALALAKSGFAVSLVGPPVATGDLRTTALMKPSLDVLAGFGIGEAIEAGAAPLRTMRIVDGTDRLVRSPTLTFRAAEIGEELFGLNIPNAHLVSVLDRAVRAEKAIARVETLVERWLPGDDAILAGLGAGLADDGTITARLAVAADGRNSPARQAAGIEIASRPTGQAALVLTFVHARPHHDISTEFHTGHGPFTQVPLPGDRSSLVWVTTPQRAAELVEMPDAEESRARSRTGCNRCSAG